MKTLRMELIVNICILTLIVCLTLGIINLTLLNKTAKEGMDTTVSLSAEAYSDAIENAIQVFKTRIESIANEAPVTHNMSIEEIRAICEVYENKYGFLRVSFANAKGVPYDNDALDITTRDYFQAAISGTTYLSSPLVSKRPEAKGAV